MQGSNVKTPRERSDGQFETDLPSGRVLVSDSRESLEEVLRNEEIDRVKDLQFLAAWKTGVKIAGERFFEVRSASVDEAMDKEDLRPSWETVENDIGVLSGGERRFLVAMCSFFNREWAKELSDQFNDMGNPGALAAQLDPSRIEVIAELMRSYRGW